jgi:hypothetical protein
MSEYGSAIFIVLVGISLGITFLTIQIRDNQKQDIEQTFPNQTETHLVNINNIFQCKQNFPQGFNHEILGNKCAVTFWKDDLDK